MLLIKNEEDGENREEDKSGGSNIARELYANFLEDIRNNGKTIRLISVKSRLSNINLHPLIIKLLNAEKTMLKKDYNKIV